MGAQGGGCGFLHTPHPEVPGGQAGVPPGALGGLCGAWCVSLLSKHLLLSGQHHQERLGPQGPMH